MNTTRTIRVQVVANAKKESVQQKGNGYVLQVKEPAQRNLANTRVRQLLARELKLPIRNIRFISGVRSPNKRFEIIS